ncbi:FliM/FliN family flagellar motor switch protein [Nevskia soli]|uniref:FliM/FliN family flagellar motor switch protein n=1 Tax=Nevskia soli TaxID=418856 RepID=UPI000691ED2B|nr:FliM/FliN family flagellar motor switch protein [Nevskia soli]
MTDNVTPAAQQPEVQRVVFSELSPRTGGANLLERPQEVIRGVKVKVSVLLGGAELSIGSLFEMKSGEVLQLDRRIDEPLELLIDGKVIARGELVVVDNSLGLRITELAAR